ncbi:PilZ domain-containing protein [Phytopseudomonas dryadis]|uniref:Pilus assembly protein PilZ n=1 Tax=Phytopseudomonas dryadis TaxID=2487520 RepID=A0A4Q9QXY1_9GAMM|nr:MULTISPECIES: PilZ domain-containing protein [Pseudomonas]TBU89994.1 pilus assembly protein PilZ [Pseudomonas dryadis]TBV02630.1 pilus assembly protein PilZ [Pseudomonas dryadis]TBV15482.1 pilus assembly protein PilZ [Pseudomonas sp. FRB 230]
MTLDVLHLEVPDALQTDSTSLAELNEQLSQARQQPPEQGLQQVLDILLRLNRSAMTLLERQRALQSFSDEYRHYAAAYRSDQLTAPFFLRLCSELAVGFKRLLLQIHLGRQPSRPHLAWCLYMAQHFLAQTLMRHYQQYQQPPAGLWRDSHLLYWQGEQQDCLDEPVAAAFQPAPASTLRGLYQQMLLLALSNPFHLAEGECALLFGALAPLAGIARLLPWDAEDERDGPLVDLAQAQPCLSYAQKPQGEPEHLRRFEIGALLVALNEPAPLQSSAERQLLERVQPHWLGREQRRHGRSAQNSACNLAIGLPAIHAQLLEQRPRCAAAQILDNGSGGARLLCSDEPVAPLVVGQLVLLMTDSHVLALVCWRHRNAQGLHLGLRYLKGLARPAWLRRTPSAQTHPGILQSTPNPGNGWHHGLWLPHGQFVEAENLWLQLSNAPNQLPLQLPAANLASSSVSRHPLELP